MLFVVGLYFVGRSVSRAVTEFVDQYTESVPRSLPRISISETELTEIRDRFESFRTAMTERQEAPPLELSARDLNALIQHDRMFTDYLFEDIPHFRTLFLDHALSGLDSARHPVNFKLRINKGFEQFERHFLGEPTLMQH